MSDLFNTGIRPLVDNYLLEESKKVRDYGEYFSASSAGYCMRRQIFERLKVPYVTEDARKQRVFTAGKIFHDWIQGITKDAGLSIAQELELQDEDLMVRGHIDDLVLVPTGRIIIDNEWHELKKFKPGEIISHKQNNPPTPETHLILYDYKSVSSRSFQYKTDKPSFFHKMQVGTYMYMLRNLAWAELERRKK